MERAGRSEEWNEIIRIKTISNRERQSEGDWIEGQAQ